MRNFLLLLAAGFVVAMLLQLNRCGGERAGRAAEQAAQPSEHVETRTERDGTETAVYTVQLADQAGAIERLTSRASRLAKDSAERRLLAAELSRVKHVQAATVFSTQAPCGDTLTQGVTVRTEQAPGVLGFLKPRESFVDIRQFTPGAHTLGAQSFALPPAKPKRWAVGVFAGVGVGPNLTPTPMVGVGITRSFIRF